MANPVDARMREQALPVTLRHGDAVRCIETTNEVSETDTGVVVARWTKPIVTVRWDKDNQPRRIHRDKLEKL